MEVALEGGLFGTFEDRLLLVAFQFVERREQRPGQRFAGAAVATLEPHDARATPHCGLESDDRLDAILARAFDVARGVAVGIDGEVAGSGLCGGLDKTSGGRQPVADRFDRPGERHDIAPLAIGSEQPGHMLHIPGGQGGVQIIEPVADDLFRITV